MATLMRTHLTKLGIEGPLRDVDQNPSSGRSRWDKPRGFWYEVNSDWRRWCESEMPEWLKGTMLYSVDLGAARILRITNNYEFRRFQHRFVVVGRERWTTGPDWNLVAKDYDGIEIAPYLWEFRLAEDCMWYYGWDCASGVVWNASKLRVEGPLTEWPAVPRDDEEPAAKPAQ